MSIQFETGHEALTKALKACEDDHITVRLHSMALGLGVTLAILHESRMFTCTRMVNLNAGLARFDAMAVAIEEAQAHLWKGLGGAH